MNNYLVEGTCARKQYNYLLSVGKQILPTDFIHKNQLDISVKSIEESSPLIVQGVSIDFLSDKWDFSEAKSIGRKKTTYTFNFTSIDSEEAKVILKLYVIDSIQKKGLHATVTKTIFGKAKELISFLKSNNKRLDQVSDVDIDFFIKGKNYCITTIDDVKGHFFDFLRFCMSMRVIPYSEPLIKYLQEKQPLSVANSYKESAKTKLLPSAFVHNLAKLLYKDFKDTQLDKIERGLSGLLYIETQVGIRATELQTLPELCLREKHCDEYKLYCLRYRSYKSAESRGKDPNIMIDVPINKECAEIINELQILFSEERKSFGEDLLFVNWDGRYNDKNRHYSELTEAKLMIHLRCFCVRNAKELGVLNMSEWGKKDFLGVPVSWGYVHTGKPSSAKDAFLSLKYSENDCIEIPTLKQFRVYCETDWFNRGIPKETIAAWHAHELEMEDYYIRPFNNGTILDMESKKIIDGVTNGEFHLHGIKGEEIEQKIKNNKTQKEGEKDINVVSTLEDLEDYAIKNQFSFVRKPIGFCFRVNAKDCHQNVEDEYSCILGTCPNKIVTYFNIPAVKDEAEKIAATMYDNQLMGYTLYAQNAAHNFIFFYECYLEPLIIEVKGMIVEEGVSEFVTKNPELKGAVVDIDGYIEHFETIKNDALEIINDKGEI